MVYPRGSEWRQWDLHIHTPESVLNQNFGDWDLYVKTLFNKAIQNNIVAIGITDYFSIDGYKILKEQYLSNDVKLDGLFANEISSDPNYINKIKSIALFPNVELRIDNVISRENGRRNAKLEYHVIFSNELSTDEIESHFLHQLKFAANVTTDGIDQEPLSRFSLTRLGEKLKQEQSGFSDYGAYFVGCMNAAINFSSIDSAFRNLPNSFKNKYLMVLSEEDISDINWNDQAHQVRKTIYSKSHVFFSSNANTINWGLQESTKDEFSSYKGCIWGSDAHDYNKLFSPEQNKYCWIKADVTFQGLLQVAIKPHDRVYIGNTPPMLEKFRVNTPKYIKNITVNKGFKSKTAENWFNFSIDLNPGLVAIIGNKGSGKSALSDIIALLCNSSKMKYASFLHQDRFLPKAKDYCGHITWYDNKSYTYIVLNDFSRSSIEYAQYLPQQHIENVCNDLNLDRSFKKEIDDVVFSHIEASERNGTNDLNELISVNCATLFRKIENIKNKLNDCNKAIIALEDKKVSEYEKKIVEAKEKKEEDLKRYAATKPKEIKLDSAQINKDIEDKNKIISALELTKSTKDKSIQELNGQINFVTGIMTDIEFIFESVNNINIKINEYTKTYSLNSKKYLLSKPDITELKKHLDELNKCKDSFKREIGNSNDTNSLIAQIHQAKTDRNSLVEKTTKEQQQYQQYQENLKKWLVNEQKLKEEKSKLEKELSYIRNELSHDYDRKKMERETLVSEIFAFKQDIANVYKRIYIPIENKLSSLLQSSDGKINFNVEIVLADLNLNENILQYIKRNVSGKFWGPDGIELLDNYINQTDFNTLDNVKEFINNIFSDVYDNIDTSNIKIPNKAGLYNYLTYLDYINPEYKLTFEGKPLHLLSPGERGNVLLVFYLALSNDDIPIIIDQPEDNLDNNSVYKRLVPCILAAKLNRQVIIVTHNPNIAVACDAEQIICCSIDKDNNTISYNSGSIENPDINEKIVDILEGTMPAFDLRKSKYYKKTKIRSAEHIMNSDDSDDSQVATEAGIVKLRSISHFYERPAAGITPSNICNVFTSGGKTFPTYNQEASFVVTIDGNSMNNGNPEGYLDGDMLYVKELDQQMMAKIPHGALGIFFYKNAKGESFLFKQFYKDEIESLRSLNKNKTSTGEPEFPDIVASEGDILTHIGIVIGKATYIKE